MIWCSGLLRTSTTCRRRVAETATALRFRRLHLGAELQNREHAGHLDQALRFLLLGQRKLPLAALLIEQKVQPLVQRLRKAQPRQMSRHWDGELNSLPH